MLRIQITPGECTGRRPEGTRRRRERRGSEVIYHRSVQQCGGRSERPRAWDVSNVVLKWRWRANTEGVCRLSVPEMVLEITDV